MPLALALLLSMAASPAATPWAGAWTYDSCHEDRKADHDEDSYCREGRDRILISVDTAGRHDITLCPSDPWGERDVRTGSGGRKLSFRTAEGHRVRLALGKDGSHFRGVFRSTDGHSGRVWGRRVSGCR